MQILFALIFGFMSGALVYMYMYEKHIKTAKILRLEEANNQLKTELSFEEYLCNEEHAYANDLLELLIKSVPFIDKGNVELLEEIKGVIKSASV